MRITVIGSGVFGAWSAWFLAERGHTITLVDAYGPANPRASSADHSRVIRCGYGADAIYSRWAHASGVDWDWLARATRRELIIRTGALFMGATSDTHLEATHATLAALDIECERLEPRDVSALYPIAADGLGTTILERDAGVLRAREAVQLLVGLLETRGVLYRVAAVKPPDEDAPAAAFKTAADDTLEADGFVCACGPWLPKMFPRSVGARIQPTRQEILHFGTPPGDDRFALARLPVWIDFQSGLYGIPDFDARGFKVGVDRHGAVIDPDTADRFVEPAIVDHVRTFLALRFPALASAPLVDSRVCQYENTHSGDFLIDRHPNWRNVWLVGGGSGHGFKHGPAVGRYLAGVVEGGGAVESRFSLAAKQTFAARAVY